MARASRLALISVLALAMVVSCGTCPPAPSITSISPSSATAGGSQFLLTVNGNDFQRDSVVSWNGSFRVTTFISSHELVATITATEIAQSGTDCKRQRIFKIGIAIKLGLKLHVLGILHRDQSLARLQTLHCTEILIYTEPNSYLCGSHYFSKARAVA
jgi:hypothetical protein